MISFELTNKIKALGDQERGSALIELLEYYDAYGLCEITEEQAKAFYKLKVKEGTNVNKGAGKQ